MQNKKAYYDEKVREEEMKGISDAEKFRGAARDILERELATAKRWLNDTIYYEHITRGIAGDVTYYSILGRRLRKVKMYETALSF